ncbi:transcriptional antiterminator RfaH [Roseivivax halotolerans]|uniref:Transcriptional antiterminator RfaH n=1 Tax=Roseivivax halotolerans TaxID=93684 RepID=A0A1I5ZUL5_9RHOB|nr:transcription termination/antitermination NusG family protein [Roseivivax halotolerans]SFQ60184.1 transcriptional antiterminator RfaH [Roseivivax halotolerans]
MPDREMPDAANWFAAQLKPNAAAIAERNLDRQGFAAFLPRRLEARRIRGKIVDRAQPLFPGYIFIQTAPERTDWRVLNATRGLTRVILSDPRKPRPLPGEFMAALMARCDDSATLTAPPSLEIGDTVRVIGGPMAELVSKIERIGEADRIELLMELMGQTARVSVSSRYLEKIEN